MDVIQKVSESSRIGAIGAVVGVPMRTPTASSNQIGILLMGGDCGALGVARSLGRKGVPVAWLPGSNSIASYSRYVQTVKDWPGVESAAAADWLIQAVKSGKWQGWLLCPAGDSEVRLVAANHAALSGAFKLCTPDWQSTKWAADKTLTYKRAAELAIPHPRTYDISSPADAKSMDCLFPLIIKPAMKEGSNVLTLSKAWLVEDRQALLYALDEAFDMAGAGGLIVQEYIPGKNDCQFSYAALYESGQPLIVMGARRSRQSPVGIGTGTFVETVDAAPFQGHAERFLASLNYTGLVEIEFKLDARDGTFKLIDVNPRVWTWNALGALGGHDFAGGLWDLAIGAPVATGTVPPGFSWHYSTRDFKVAMAEIWSGKLSVATYLARDILRSGHAIFATDDLLPFVMDLPLALMRRWLRPN